MSGPSRDMAERTGVVLPHMGSADFDTRKKMAELCISRARPAQKLLADLAGVRNAVNGARGEALLAEVKV